MFKLTWNEREARAESTAQVETRLQALESEFRSGKPTLVTVERMDDGDTLSIGLGLEISVLSYVSGKLDPPYFISLGGTDDTHLVGFLFGGEESEFTLRNTIPVAVARRVMLHFCEHGSLSTEIAWEEG